VSRTDIHSVLRAATREHVLPATAVAPSSDAARPWPVVLLTALGAWLAALPLLGVVGLLLGDMISRGAGPYVVGALLLAGATVVLRSRELPLFIEQLAVPALLVGGGALGFGLFRDLSTAAGAAGLTVVALAVGVAVRGAWLRVLLGAAAAVLFVVALAPKRWFFAAGDVAQTRWWLCWHLALLVWLVVLWVQRAALREGALARAAGSVESLAAGWLLATLAGVAWWSGMTFLAGAGLGGALPGEIAREIGRGGGGAGSMALASSASVVLALAAAAWSITRWRGLRRAWWIGVALVLAALAGFMPSLGAVLLAMAVCVTTHRWRLAGAAALAAAWIVGAFYYQLAWPLASKATLLAAAGAALGALAWWAGAQRHVTLPANDSSSTPSARWGIAASAVAVLAAANIGIWQKEDLIAHGRALYVELAPRDPRSLMQGDFMSLNFRVPSDASTELDKLLRGKRPHAVLRRDAQGIAALLRIDNGTPLAADEMRIELTPKDGRWILVSDAWFFREGEAARWQRAKYGEFRVDANGRALLVGLRGAKLEAL
jgi:uncharacterized membrane-anchored protein